MVDRISERLLGRFFGNDFSLGGGVFKGLGGFR